jgi:hypothetical protein
MQASPLAPSPPAGIVIAPRQEVEERTSTARYVKPADLAMSFAGARPGPAPRAEPDRVALRAGDRRPPEPVIPGVGKRRVRRKDGGLPP